MSMPDLVETRTGTPIQVRGHRVTLNPNRRSRIFRVVAESTETTVGACRRFSFGGRLMNLKQIANVIRAIACLIGAIMFLPDVGQAQDAKVKAAMELLESKANRLGPPKIEGTEAVGGKAAPAIYFGSTRMNNNFELVDDVVKQVQGTATIFVKSGDEYIRVATRYMTPLCPHGQRRNCGPQREASDPSRAGRGSRVDGCG
ncbi:Cache 3/Cache 2 fusion domain-containing protein [Bradyrhizobium genosp. SA-3]|uniref:Cache 3/Cache 2 fusion domain-containing protein n=1 Tax=Bradyrhizobium genosp. SA-3 TaxID=508868 RepID=UPI0013EEB563|nr:Cache 3/Cache 2 fusion domain-containing protein [Bradyrhizobium genosp. SA-3]